MTPLITATDLSKSFPIEGGVLRRTVGKVQALDQVSFDLPAGQTLAIVGGSGCGKSTLARVIVGLLDPDAGTLLWDGQSMVGWTRRERAFRMQMIFQDPYASLNPKLSVETQLSEGVRLALSRSAAAGTDVRARCVELLTKVGLTESALPLYPFQFSGGQRQRIAMARALALEPALLVADEPLSALDVTIQAQMLDLFLQLKRDLGLTLIFITHDLAILPGFADQILVLENGVTVEQGAASAVLAKPQHAYTQSLLAALPPSLP